MTTKNKVNTYIEFLKLNQMGINKVRFMLQNNWVLAYLDVYDNKSKLMWKCKTGLRSSRK